MQTEREGVSVFFRDPMKRVYHTYSTWTKRAASA